MTSRGHRDRIGRRQAEPGRERAASGRRQQRAVAAAEEKVGGAAVSLMILDRLAMHAIRIDITGPSYRQHVAKSRAERVR
jgi:hypothetical protein